MGKGRAARCTQEAKTERLICFDCHIVQFRVTKFVNVKFIVGHHLEIFLKAGELGRVGDRLGRGERKDAKKEGQESVDQENEMHFSI